MHGDTSRIDDGRQQKQGGCQLLQFTPSRRHDPKGERLIAVVARARGVSPLMMMQTTRGRASAAAARQIAMYLMRVSLGRTYAETGRFFGRDRKTVSHACSHIEDRRIEGSKLEEELLGLEAELEAARAGQDISDAC